MITKRYLIRDILWIKYGLNINFAHEMRNYWSNCLIVLKLLSIFTTRFRMLKYWYYLLCCVMQPLSEIVFLWFSLSGNFTVSFVWAEMLSHGCPLVGAQQSSRYLLSGSCFLVDGCGAWRWHLWLLGLMFFQVEESSFFLQSHLLKRRPHGDGRCLSLSSISVDLSCSVSWDTSIVWLSLLV